MVLTEKSFPRGGTLNIEAKVEKAASNIDFGAVQKKIKKPKKPKSDQPNDLEDVQDETVTTTSAELLNYDTVQEGMVIMGVVKAVGNLYLSISLPGRLTARVPATEISAAYMKVTQNFIASGGQNQDLGYKSLEELFTVGQIVYARVQEVQKDASGRICLSMSMKPDVVHADLHHSKIRKGFMFSGAIQEVQEHGYIIETGVQGLRAFVPLEKSKSTTSAIGQLLYLKVEKITNDQAVSTCTCKEIDAERLKVKDQLEPNIDYILPASIVGFRVNKQLKDGLQGTIMNGAFISYVNEHQLADALSLVEDYEVGAELKARILYVMPLTKLVYLTLNLRNKNEAEESSKVAPLKPGEIIEKAKVHHLGTGGVVLVLNNKFKGIISYRTIKAGYQGNYDPDALLVKYARKTMHKVRVLDYDLMDQLYICTDNEQIVNEKVFELADLNAGDIVTATVKQAMAEVGGYAMLVGRVRGLIESIYLANSAQFVPQAKVRCRVLHVSQDRKTVYLTNRPEYLLKDSKMLTSLKQAKVNAVHTGTIVTCADDRLIVKFLNNIKGVLYKHQLNALTASQFEAFRVGQTSKFVIASVNDERLMLTLPDDVFTMGEICPVEVVNVLESGLEIKISHNDGQVDAEVEQFKGLIPLNMLSDFEDLLGAKLRTHPVGTHTSAACMFKSIFSLRDVAFFSEHQTANWASVKPGDILRAFIQNVEGDVIELMVPIRKYDKLVRVHAKMFHVGRSDINLAIDQVVFVRVLSKEPATKTLTVTAKLTDIWSGDIIEAANRLASYLAETEEIRRALKQQQAAPIAKYARGDKVKATFAAVESNNDWIFEVGKRRLAGVMRAKLHGQTTAPEVGETQECIVLWIDYSKELLYLSNRSGDIKHVAPAEELPTNLVEKTGINAKVLLKLDNIVLCTLKNAGNPIIYCPIKLHCNDFENAASTLLREGEFCKLSFIHPKLPIAVPDSVCKFWRTLKRKSTEAEVNQTRQKKLKLECSNDKEDKGKTEEHALEACKEQNKQQKAEKSKLKRERAVQAAQEKTKGKRSKTEADADSLFYEDKKPDYNNVRKATVNDDSGMTKSAKVNTKMPGIADFWSTDLSTLSKLFKPDDVESSDDDDNEEGESTGAGAQKKKKLSSKEKLKAQREEEARLCAIEEKYADPNHVPETVDQFDRLVVSEPNNSKHWINYMVYHLEHAEIDKARAVGKRALKAISFRESQELMNVWIALLNLELRYDDKESYESTLKEALTYNDPFKVYMSTLNILSGADKKEELIEMVELITKKFKAKPEMWRAAANAYFSLGMTEQAQKLLHRSLQSLPEREHVNTIVAFANLNQRYGNDALAQTLLDEVVTSYPKRVDVWTQYVDLLVKSQLIESARHVLERASKQVIPLKKMRTIFTKYLEFEQKYGSEEDVLKVKSLAADYVKKASAI